MEMTIDALNEIDAKLNDRVEIELSDEKVLTAAFIVYIIPLFALFIGIGGTQLIMESFGFLKYVEVFGVIVGMLLMAISFLVIRQNDKARREGGKYEVTITKILEEDESTCSIHI